MGQRVWVFDRVTGFAGSLDQGNWESNRSVLLVVEVDLGSLPERRYCVARQQRSCLQRFASQSEAENKAIAATPQE